ncbi:TIGR04282 family arsenosugar biosynthesis glycosyltransferase [Magnetococcales bacterium HHB-1]
MRQLVLNLLGKAPQPGYAKTRLIPTLGEEGAAFVQERLLTHTISVCKSWTEEHSDRSFSFWCAPDCHHPFFQAALSPGELHIQKGADLGERLAWIAGKDHEEGHLSFLIGGDWGMVSALGLDRMEKALREGAEVVITPAEDGGYVAIGLSSLIPDLFLEIPWGSDRVLAESMKRLQGRTERVELMDLSWDVDKLEDWQRFCRIVEGNDQIRQAG